MTRLLVGSLKDIPENNVKIFLARGSETYRGTEKQQVERPKWKLAFQVSPKFPIMTGENIRDANGNPLRVILVDTDPGQPASALPGDVLQIELVPLLGNFPRDNWEADDFQRGVVEDVVDWQGRKHPVLAGEYRLTMWNGLATVSELMFTDDSLNCGCMFRIGVRVVPDSYDHGARILEGMTEAFMVRDRHVYESHYNENYKWQLAFQSQPRLPIYVGRQIRDDIGTPLEVILVDAETGLPSALPVMELRIELVSLFACFDPQKEDWSAHGFQRAVRKPGSGVGEVYLSGDVSLTMKHDGHVTVNKLQYTGAYVIYNGHIGVRVVPGSYNDPGTIREGITKAFRVQDSRVEEMKRFPPVLDDEVWRLKCISFGGVFHRRLTQNNIINVKDFLAMLAVKPDELREIVGDGMDDSTWSKEIISHARTCLFPPDKLYAYNMEHTTIYMNSIFDLIKVELSGVKVPLHRLDEAQKKLVQQAMQEAYEQRHNLQEVKPSWKLAFKSQPRLPMHAGGSIEDAMGKPLEIILVDAKTGSPSALPMNLKIQLVPIIGDFPPYDDEEDWSAEEFRSAIVKQRQIDVPLLKQYYNNLIMSDGRVTVPKELQFTDDSSWVRCRKFRIGARVVQWSGFRIVEAMTEAFVVGDLNRKHYPPALSDPVWRLEMIDKDGASQWNLTSNNVDTVQEFVRMLNIKPDELHAIVGDAMTDSMWDMTARHAREWCDPGDKVYVYSRANSTIYVDSVFRRLLMIEIDGVSVESPRQWDKAQTMIARQMILEAYEHRHNLQEVDAAKELLVDDPVYHIGNLLPYTECYVQVDRDDDNLDDENDHA